MLAIAPSFLMWILGWRSSSQADVASCLHLPSPGFVLLYLAFYVDPGNRTIVRLTGLTLYLLRHLPR